MFPLVLLVALVVLSTVRTIALVRTDGLGSRPGPRSHAAETLGTTWPHHEAVVR